MGSLNDFFEEHAERIQNETKKEKLSRYKLECISDLQNHIERNFIYMEFELEHHSNIKQLQKIRKKTLSKLNKFIKSIK